MIKKINIKEYRKLKDVEFKFNPGINIISGTNGTCKTSLLHIISNSFQTVTKSADWLKDTKILDTIKALNKLNNPKIETLTRGDEKYNNPAPGVSGKLFTCEYYNGKILEFRRHNTGADNSKHRFALKPRYMKGKAESLPSLPVIYLGLFRLFSFGEFDKDDDIKKINKKIPNDYLEEIKGLYENFTGIKIEYENQSDMGGIKNRAEFKSNQKGIDSNTISAGEDNLFIILTALVSLKYYYENIKREVKNDVESLLLIDEIDATLHPAFQVKLLDLFEKYSEEYSIQIIFTTHSLSLLEYALFRKLKVIYLMDFITKVEVMDSVDKFQIEMYLKNKAQKDIYSPKNIPIFTEDKEARLFLKELFIYYQNKNEQFNKISRIFHFVEANFSSESLKTIFMDDEILKRTIRSICILDGDQQELGKERSKIANHILTLPSNKSPEDLFFDYSKKIYQEDSDFWRNDTIYNSGYTKLYFKDNIEAKINNIDIRVKEEKRKKREINKEIFQEYQEFFIFIIRHWLHDENNVDEIEKFYKNFNNVFKKIAIFHGINPNDWNID